MASNYQEFVTTVKLNSEEANNKLEHLRKDTERWIKELLSQMQKKEFILIKLYASLKNQVNLMLYIVINDVCLEY